MTIITLPEDVEFGVLVKALSTIGLKPGQGKQGRLVFQHADRDQLHGECDHDGCTHMATVSYGNGARALCARHAMEEMRNVSRS